MSLAVGAWLRDITTGYMRVETMSLDAAYATIGPVADDDTITASVRNSGKDSIYLDKAYMDEVQVMDLAGLELPADMATDVIIVGLTLGDGKTYEVKIVSTGGAQLVFSVRTP